jgi:outer membrane lipoprotein-sorting protein
MHRRYAAAALAAATEETEDWASFMIIRGFPAGRRVRLALALVLALAAVVPGAAPAGAAPKAATLSAQDRADAQRIEQYLNGVHTLAGRFQQYAPDGTSTNGKIYLSRPGKMRFEYDAPSPILLLADGTFVVYVDNKLKQVTYLPIGSTPAWFLLRDKVSLEDGVTVTRFEHGKGVIRVTVVQTKSPDEGSLTMTFSDRPLDLKQWTVVDQQGKSTTVALSDTRYDVPVSPQLFTFVDPRKGSPEEPRSNRRETN